MAVKFRTSEQYMQRLRDAMFSDMGLTKDVLRPVAAFAKFDRNGLDSIFEFETGKTLSAKTRSFIFKLTKAHMQETIDENGYGWDDEDQEDEVREESRKYLIVRNKEDRKIQGFVAFNFTVQGAHADVMEGFPTLLVENIQLKPQFQRKGLGRHLMMTLEMIARKQQMTYLTIKVYKGAEAAEAFVEEKLKGMAPETIWTSTADKIQMFEKLLTPADLQKEGVAAVSSPQASTPPTEPKAEKADDILQTATIASAQPVKLDKAFADAIKLAPAPKASPTPAVVLAFFYESVVGEPKTKEQISDIIEKRRRSSPKWFETLCSKLQKKYGKSPVDAYKEKQTKEEAVAAEAAKAKSETAHLAPALSAENKESAAQAMTPALEQLAAVFREQHNREPTEEERGRWQASFEAAVAGAQNSSGVGKEAGAEGALPSFGAQQ